MTLRTSSPALAGALLLALAAGCAGPPLDVNEVLDTGAPEGTSSTGARVSLVEFDERARVARSAAEIPGDVATAVEAARALFLAADARVQRATLERLDALGGPSLDDVLGANDALPAEVRAEVESLTTEGLELARRALEQAPGDPDALLYRGLNTTLLAWSVGPQRALFAGLGKRCEAATAACLELDEAHGDGAALRLRGRFLSQAPWPVGDREEGLALLRRAVEVAPVRLNLLFLGDALQADGDLEGAREAWRRATEAAPDADSAPLAGAHRELALRRLAASR